MTTNYYVFNLHSNIVGILANYIHLEDFVTLSIPERTSELYSSDIVWQPLYERYVSDLKETFPYVLEIYGSFRNALRNGLYDITFMLQRINMKHDQVILSDYEEQTARIEDNRNQIGRWLGKPVEFLEQYDFTSEFINTELWAFVCKYNYRYFTMLTKKIIAAHDHTYKCREGNNIRSYLDHHILTDLCYNSSPCDPNPKILTKAEYLLSTIISRHLVMDTFNKYKQKGFIILPMLYLNFNGSFCNRQVPLYLMNKLLDASSIEDRISILAQFDTSLYYLEHSTKLIRIEKIRACIKGYIFVSNYMDTTKDEAMLQYPKLLKMYNEQ